jgi:hypothetical protein
MPEITQIKKLDADPPLFFVTVDGETLEVETRSITRSRKNFLLFV